MMRENDQYQQTETETGWSALLHPSLQSVSVRVGVGGVEQSRAELFSLLPAATEKVPFSAVHLSPL